MNFCILFMFLIKAKHLNRNHFSSRPFCLSVEAGGSAVYLLLVTVMRNDDSFSLAPSVPIADVIPPPGGVSPPQHLYIQYLPINSLVEVKYGLVWMDVIGQK